MIKLEYIWLDGNKPQQLRSKVKITKQSVEEVSLQNLSGWSFDGSSTGQAEGKDSDCYLKPVYFCKNPLESNSLLVLCEVMNEDGTPHTTNTRSALVKAANNFAHEEPWFGIEQEYFFYKDGKPLGWPTEYNAYPPPQGTYYCGVGADRVFGRDISVEHATACMEAGLAICGTNAEVMTSQWEYQIGAVDALEVSDHLWMSRYIMHKITEKYDCSVTFLPKPFADYAGSGLHTNVSTKEMREEGGLEHIYKACEKLRITHKKHIDLYGEGNNNRLTGRNETCSYEEYKYGVRNRGCSVRIPLSVYNDKKGYLEDRRPGSNADPYVITSLLMESIVFQEL